MFLAEPTFDALIALLAEAGYPRFEPTILQPAAIFFESGEDLRGQLYLTTDVSGAEYCLRPEYTIPVSLAYLASNAAGARAAFSYGGPVFRFRSKGAGEFIQAGLENFGRLDIEAADAEILSLTLAALRSANPAGLQVRIGDAGLFSGLLEALDLPPQWRRRIKRGHAQGKTLKEIMNAATSAPGSEHSGVLALLEGADKQGARALVEDLFSIAGIASVGGRTSAEIAERFLEQAALKTGLGFSTEKAAIIKHFLSVEGDPDQALAVMRELAHEARLDLAAMLDRFETRLGFIAAMGLDVSALIFATSFTRNLDYYTGFVFEVLDASAAGADPIAGGGRYDELLQRLGASAPIPAVGAAILVERLSQRRISEAT